MKRVRSSSDEEAEVPPESIKPMFSKDSSENVEFHQRFNLPPTENVIACKKFLKKFPRIF